MTVRLSRERARRLLVHHHHLDRRWPEVGARGVRSWLDAARHIQLDPLDRIGTNADLVALARIDGLMAGDVYRHLLPGHAFEHFAKERCLLPARALPHYRQHGATTPWWRAGARRARLDQGLLDDVLAEVGERGPVAVAALTDRGRVEPLDWNGWKGTGKATTIAVEVLWRRCDLVVCGRQGRGKVVDLPDRALPQVAHEDPTEAFEPWALLERVEAAGLLARTSGAWWSTLQDVRRSELPDAMVADDRLADVQIEGSRRRFLAPPSLLDADPPPPDDRLRILGPLDALIWDRRLIEDLFDFTYVWEVYKPAAARRWGWYVCPLLHRGRFVGRLEAHVEAGRLVVDRLWREAEPFPDDALQEALARHATALGAVV